MDAFEKSSLNYVEKLKSDCGVLYKCPILTNLDEGDEDADMELFEQS